MKANKLARDEEGDFGIGTMIIFIAMIVVAVVAATVIIETMNNLQGQAYRTAKDASERVASGVDVRLVTMERAETLFGISALGVGSAAGQVAGGIPGLRSLNRPANYLQNIKITLQLRAGSAAVGLDNATITVLSPKDMMVFSGEAAGETRAYSIIKAVKDDDESITNMRALNVPGDVAEVTVDVSDLGITPGVKFQIRVQPQVGMASTVECSVPVGFAYDTQSAQIYP